MTSSPGQANPVRRRRGPRYSALRLAWHGVTGRPWQEIITERPLRDRYHVAIIGGGVHGLATAYYLAEYHGIRDVVVLERGYVGGGNSGRNTAIVRANYLTPDGIRFYERSLRLYERMTDELNFNVMFEPRGQLTLAHNDGALRTLRWRAEANTAMGVESTVIDPNECARLVPRLNLSAGAHYPVFGGLWHPRAGIVRHDAVVWAYARAANRAGGSIQQSTDVLGLRARDDGSFDLHTSRGATRAPVVVNCTAGWASTVAGMLGVRLPVRSVPLQAAVTEPVKPFLRPILSSSNLHVYVSQTTRGELVLGGAVDPYPSYSARGSLDFLERTAAGLLELLPSLAQVRVLRHWAGVCDMTPDAAPIIGKTSVPGFLLDVGWGTYGFKAGPAAGEALASLIATGRIPDLIAAFGMDRFETGALINEKGAAAVGH
jgi:sarcosine oxidase subunit beta